MIASRQIAFGRGAVKPYDAEIEYLESTGGNKLNATYIDTGIHLTGGSSVEIKYRATDTTLYYPGIFSSRKYPIDHTTSYTLLGYDRFDYGRSSVGNWTRDTLIHTLLCKPTGSNLSVILDGIQLKTTPLLTFTSAETTILFADRANVGFGGAIYYFKIWDESGKLIFDAIPVRVGSVGYMYDKVSGTLFGNSGTGEFVLGPDVETIEYTAKDYVQDGLIAMWDGIENAGWGVHDSAATVWKDLVGDMDFVLESNKSASFSSSSLHLDYRSSYNRVHTNKTAKIVTLEILGRYDNGSRIIFINNSASAEAIVIQGDMTRVQFTNGISKVVSYDNLIGSRNLLSVEYQNNSYAVDSVYVNGVDIALTSLTNSWGLETADAFSLGARTGSSYLSGFGGDYYSIRAYSRALSAEEIAHNYNVDKARFGL